MGDKIFKAQTQPIKEVMTKITHSICKVHSLSRQSSDPVFLHPVIHPPINPHTHPPTCLSIHPSIHPAIHTSTHLSNHFFQPPRSLFVPMMYSVPHALLGAGGRNAQVKLCPGGSYGLQKENQLSPKGDTIVWQSVSIQKVQTTQQLKQGTFNTKNY